MDILQTNPLPLTMSHNINSLLEYRQQGNTTSLINVLLANQSAKLVVHDIQFLTFLSNKYKLPRDRFIPVDKLAEILPFTTGPILFDITAVVQLLIQSNIDASMLRFLYKQLPAAETSRWGNTPDQFIAGVKSHMALYDTEN